MTVVKAEDYVGDNCFRSSFLFICCVCGDDKRIEQKGREKGRKRRKSTNEM